MLMPRVGLFPLLNFNLRKYFADDLSELSVLRNICIPIRRLHNIRYECECNVTIILKSAIKRKNASGGNERALRDWKVKMRGSRWKSAKSLASPGREYEMQIGICEAAITLRGNERAHFYRRCEWNIIEAADKGEAWNYENRFTSVRRAEDFFLRQLRMCNPFPLIFHAYRIFVMTCPGFLYLYIHMKIGWRYFHRFRDCGAFYPLQLGIWLCEELPDFMDY